MIESIRISKTATFSEDRPQFLEGLSQFNYFFGSNGTGKTTVSKLINNISQFPHCSIKWVANSPMETLVYNQDYVKINFDQSEHLKGVFTIGKKHKETLDKIPKVKQEIEYLTTKLQRMQKKLDGDETEVDLGKIEELNQLEEQLKSTCWAQKQKYDEIFKDAFKGVRDKTEKFKEKIKQEEASNKAELKNINFLKDKANIIFGEKPLIISKIQEINFSELLKYEKDSILKKVVIGKGDVDIAKMIKKLNNSDWIKEGITYYENNDRICPFCQQKTDALFSQSLNDYFDEVFISDLNSIKELNINYAKEAERIQSLLEQITSTPSDFLDLTSIKSKKIIFESKIAINKQKISTKQKLASQIIDLESLESITLEISKQITEANVEIDTHNEMVRNLSIERTTLIDQVWKFILEELKNDLKIYKSTQNILNKTIKGLKEGIQDKTKKILEKKTEWMDLEKQTTSMIPTRNSINSILKSFGFQGFRLEIVENSNQYKLVRSDGSDAKNSLSEGEKTFITFLYFYHLLKGSNSESGTIINRVVVFDDPVSSLDSDILFIVSSLIKGLMTEVRENTGSIKQIFVLTHNVYFHKEITFNPKRCETAMNEETFWIIRKISSISVITKEPTNPIKTSYELLWSEIRGGKITSQTLQNTLRRILENYYKILGNKDFDSICEKFEGKEKFICKSLFSWVNAGSHFVLDDLYINVDDSQIDLYLNIFKKIFIKTEQINHYNMMMGIDG